MTEQPADASAQPDTSQEDSQDDSSSSEESTRSDQKQDLDSGAPGDIGDDQLPEDLQPTEDNPLARHPGQSGDEDDQIGADREDDPDTAPLTAEDADYGSGGAPS
jgi:hypothetical protein